MKITFSLLFLSLFLNPESQDNWELQKDKNGIQVYTQTVEGSDLKAFKSITEIDCSIETLVAVCKDVAAFPEWQDATKIAKILKNNGETEHIHYLEFPAPWPVSHRDCITQFTYSFNSTDQSVRVQFESFPDYLPTKDGIIRIRESTGYYLFTPLSSGKIKVTHSAHANPAGSIPAWLSNSIVVDTPFKTLTNLKKQVKKAKYQGKTYDFIKK